MIKNYNLSKRVQTGIALMPALWIVIFYSSMLYFYLRLGHIPYRLSDPQYDPGDLFFFIKMFGIILMFLGVLSIIIWFFVVVIGLLVYRTINSFSWLSLLLILFSVYLVVGVPPTKLAGETPAKMNRDSALLNLTFPK